MRALVAMLATAAAVAASGCGATARPTAVQTRTFPTLTSATATFDSTDDGKDAESNLTVQLLRNNGERGAEIRTVDTKFDDHSSSGPFAFSMTGPFTTGDVNDGELRLRLAADGADDWTST